MPKVYIIILNYDNWKDTIECLESVYKLDYSNFQVVVVDNHSTDGSVEALTAWAAGDLEVKLEEKTSKIEKLVYPVVSKPIATIEYQERDVLAGKKIESKPLVIIKAGENRGFAAGNNLGLKYAALHADFEYAWLLNNDTVVEPSALSQLVKRYSSLRQTGIKVGLLGCKIMYYYQPKVLQCAGGAVYNPWTGFVKQIGNYTEEKYSDFSSDLKLDYISGASMFLDKHFLKDVGLLEEQYFLYFEELDWALRSNKAGYTLSYTPEAKVYHKEGGTISKLVEVKSEKSKLSDFYSLRSKILFTRKFYPHCLPSIYLSIGYTLLNRVRRGQADRVKMLLKLVFNPRMKYEDSIKNS